jgi:O-antigen/teichoic acid export membrane protein
MMVSSVVVLLFFRINHILVARLASYTELGKYSVAFQIVQAASLPMVVLTAAYPRLVELHKADNPHFRKVMDWLYFTSAVGGYAVCILTFLLSDAVVSRVFGQRYTGTGPILSILMVSMLFNYLGNVRAQEININNAPSYHLINATIGLAVLVPTSIVLTTKFHAVGAAFGTAIASFVSGVLTSFIFPRTRDAGWAQLRSLVLLPPSRSQHARS